MRTSKIPNVSYHSLKIQPNNLDDLPRVTARGWRTVRHTSEGGGKACIGVGGGNPARARLGTWDHRGKRSMLNRMKKVGSSWLRSV